MIWTGSCKVGDMVQVSKKLGGLGVGDVVVRDTTLLFKWLEWVWNFQWKRKFRQWEAESLNQLLEVLQSEETLKDDIVGYRFANEIWKGLVPPHVELFMWFVLVGQVNTKDRLSRLGIIEQRDTVCVLCNKNVETVQHLFVTCEFSWLVWCAWITHFGRHWTISNTIKEH
ncbi:hypothetical protein AHAS_Ahas08G0033800 [Arachis hypogaea]